MESIVIKDMSFGYTDTLVLENVNLTINQGEFVALIGGNGTGKSTLLKNLLGELTPDNGDIKVFGKSIKKHKDYQKIGYVPQLSIVDQIAFPVTTTELVSLNLYREFGLFKYAKKEQIKKAEDILVYLGLEKYLGWPVNQLSGGLKQRTMIARAMVNKPDLLILDEPTAGIDQQNREAFIRMINKLNSEMNLTILLVTHELTEVMEFGDIDSVYEVKDRKVSKVDRPELLCKDYCSVAGGAS